jgi:hypothetical protein
MDGDACFSVSLNKSNCRTTLSIAQKEPEVINILNRVLFNDKLNIYHYSRIINKLETNTNSNLNIKHTYHDNLSTVIPNISILNKLIPYELRTRKRHSLKIFSEIVSMKENNIHLTEEGANLISLESKLINAHTLKNGYLIYNSKLLYND